MARSYSFTTVPYSIVGDSMIVSAKDVSIQRTKNMMAIPTPNGVTPAAMVSFPGLKIWSTGTAGAPDRGMYKRTFRGLGYKVSGGHLYSITSAGVQVSVGVISGSDAVTFADNGTTLAICNGSALYTYDGATLAVLSLAFTPVMIDYINNQFMVLDSTGAIRNSTAGTLTFSSLDVYEAESTPDAMVAIKVFNQFVFNFKTRGIEPWENTGSGSPPFERMNGAIIEEVGLANRSAMAETSDSVYFLGSDKTPYALINFQARPLTDNNPGIAELFQTYSSDTCAVTSARAFGQDIIIYTFPENAVTWAYSSLTGFWFELDYDVDSQLWIGKSIARLFNKTLVADRRNGNIYELDTSTYTNNSTTMVRERVFQPLSGESTGAPRQLAQMKCIRFAAETGVGSGDTSPQMIVRFSFDGGRTFGNERWIRLGETGQYISNVETYSNQKFKDVSVLVRYTESTRFSLYDASIDIREAGR